MTTQKKNFTASNPNFIARIIIFVLSVFTLIGVQFPSSPEAIADNITTTVSTSGIIAVAGILLVSVIMPIYNLVRTKPKITISTIFGNPNFWIYAGSFAFGLLVLVGIHIPEGTAAELVGAIWAKDWAALSTIAFTNIIDPVIRYFLDRKNVRVAALEE
jgi:hypothetical protein